MLPEDKCSTLLHVLTIGIIVLLLVYLEPELEPGNDHRHRAPNPADEARQYLNPADDYVIDTLYRERMGKPSAGFRYCLASSAEYGAEEVEEPPPKPATRSRSHLGNDGGEGDSSGGPVSKRGLKGSWPTLVIEAGVSESSSTLREDMRWWFLASNHNVKIVLLTKFDHQNQTIIIERWEEELQNRQGATRTR
ncbi:hypothetical protein O1611_g6658 [Lasiodiplodia mahajangana]|uniref:Uncharacterized protein n=1 Tax=Lasiodiplodia mahajangana TaxID=1108764 RepID=A0ACC2JHN9_9PEZI|nr:hypothetical protein O1611_g6658 [Lasiodiplodia mahajangana]